MEILDTVVERNVIVIKIDQIEGRNCRMKIMTMFCRLFVGQEHYHGTKEIAYNK